MSYYSVSPYGGATMRLLLTDCEGAEISAAELQKIRYSIYSEAYGLRQPVTGHEDVEVSADCYLETPQTSVHGGTFNFQHRISAANALPFPELNMKYVVVYLFFDADGEPHPHEILCFTETNK